MRYRKLLSTILLLAFFNAAAAQQTEEPDPDPLRFEEQIEQFKNWDRKNSTPTDPILFVGSSSIRLWDTAVAFPDLAVLNRGFGGSHTSDVQYFYEDLIAPYNPSLIVFYEGDNDIAAGKPVEQVMSDYQQLVQRILKDKPNVNFLYVPIKPSSSRWDQWPRMDQLNQQIKEYNSTHARLHYADLATPVLNENGLPDNRLFLDDQLHLNKQGYDKWNDAIRPVLKRLVK
ncbi:GDSL-type esterase/lipase family protein [Fodinibius sediminis]|uniref:Lysophospholipase L1 n=1 Tax=Fodinibius sediminis TaxID=1214077 RepID=A0A521CTU9_9BACT|nr:GDSL-type esterase/lipase family protein [Fodinibius sediminis]SMO62090.1 Lysophospholipase L1 [Fodinibius sediminis]